MPINIDYSPVGALTSAAAMAGQGEGQRQSFAQDMQLLDLTQRQNEAQMRQSAQNRAFDLQEAMASRQLAAQTRTPAADHIAERADLARSDRAAKQNQFKGQLDTMLSTGTIDPTQYQKGLMALMTGNETLMTHVLANPKATVEKPNISNAAELDVIREPFREKRRILESSLTSLNTNLAKFGSIPEMAEPIKTQKNDIQKQIDDQFAQETAAIDKWRQAGHGQAATQATPGSGFLTDASGQTTAISSDTGAFPGTGRMTTQATISPSMRAILDQARGMAGANAGKIGGDQMTTTTIGEGQPITQDIAQQIMQETGGDKVKARQLARARGYIF